MDLLVYAGALRSHDIETKSGYKWKPFCFVSTLPMIINNTLEYQDSLAHFLVYGIHWAH